MSTRSFIQAARLLTVLVALAGAGAAPGLAAYAIEWYTVDGGGGMFSTGGTFEVGGTIGQPDAGPLTGGTYALSGGFWGIGPQFAPGDMNCDGLINSQDIDGFVYVLFGDLAAYDAYLHSFAEYHPCPFLSADFDGNGLVNSQDIDGFLDVLFGP